MSELRNALQAILQVNFKEAVPMSDASKIADFLERAAIELNTRVEAVEVREQAVSQRESKVAHREEEASAHMRTIAALGRTAKVLELRPRRRLWSIK